MSLPCVSRRLLPMVKALINWIAMQIWVFLPLGSHLWQKKVVSGLHAADQNFQGRMCHKGGFIVSLLHPIPSGWSQPGNFGDDPPFLYHWLDMVRRKRRLIWKARKGRLMIWNGDWVCLSGSPDRCESLSEDNGKQNTIQEKEWALLSTQPWSLVNRTSRQTFLS